MRQTQKKSWLQRLNPFLAGEVPPVPLEDAGLVPDIQANFWNKLTWGWMSPLMMVLPAPRSLFTNRVLYRSDINDRCRKKIYGIMMNRGGPVFLLIN